MEADILTNYLNFKIFIIDDEVILAHSCRRILEKIGFTNCEIFYDAETAIKRGESNPPKLIITDDTMPNMSGREASFLFKKVYNVPILGIGGWSYDFWFNESKEIAIDDYLRKPFNNNDLIDKIKTLLIKYYSE